LLCRGENYLFKGKSIMSQERKTLVLFTAFYGLIVLMDYFTTVDDFFISLVPALDGFLNSKSLYGAFNQHGVK
jgi:hypothetical protein